VSDALQNPDEMKHLGAMEYLDTRKVLDGFIGMLLS
jgi:hypothetical protein